MTSILVVDDHAVNREFLATLLGYQGYAVLEAVDGSDALARTREERPDLVIADILMPTMDGYEFVRQLRDDPAIAHTPVIFFTAVYHERETRQLAESCGVSHVLTKPCEPEVVLQTIDSALETRSAPPAAPVKEDFDREHLRLMTDKLSRTVDDLGVANKRFAALIDINLQLASEREPERLLDGLCSAARGLIGARYALLAVGGRGDAMVKHSVTAGIEPGIADRLEHEALGSGRIGVAYTERRAFRLVNPGGDPAAVGLPRRHPPAHSVLVAPIVSLKHVYGWICLTDRIGSDEFSEEDEKLLTILAAQVGRIYENGDLYLEVRENEEKFRQIAENIHEVFFLVDPALSHMTYISPAYEDIWGRTAESLYENPRAWLDAIHHEDAGRIVATFGDTRATGRFDYEFRIVRPDGDTRWIHARGFPIHDEEGKIYRIAGIAENITERRQAEDRMKRLNRMYAVLSGINAAIVRIRDRQALFEEVCRILVKPGRFEMVWVGLLDQDTLAVTQSAWLGPGSDYELVAGVNFSGDEQIEGGRTTVGRSIRGRRPAISYALGGDAETGSEYPEVARRGYRRMVSLPLLSGEECLGVIVLYSKEPGTFDEDEMQLLTELAEDVSYALDYIKNEQQVSYLAFHDPLTGLANRSALYRRLNEVIEDAGPRDRPFALLLMNINNFQNINHTLGHYNGDLLLVEIAERIAGVLWHSDVVACLGGDEFAILLPSLADKRDIDLVIKKITRALKEIFIVQELPIVVEARLGVALYPEHGGSADLLWQHADIALRAAKEMHRTWMLYEKGIDHYDPNQLTLIGGLHTAMARNELLLHYQPTIDLRTGQVQGVEALLRWRHPENGLIYPDKFIPLVERTGMIDALTSWVLANALEQGHLWHGNGLLLDLSVNLSARNLHNPNLSNEIIDCAGSFSFPLEKLRLEITESAIMSDPDHTRSVLETLDNARIRLSVDDFGIGQSSLAYVRDLPVSEMKIDKSFVMEFARPRNAAIVKTAVELGHNLGLTVTAEGVEDEDTYAALCHLGCDAAQGYFFSKPLPVDTLTTWLRESRWRYVPR